MSCGAAWRSSGNPSASVLGCWRPKTQALWEHHPFANASYRPCTDSRLLIDFPLSSKNGVASQIRAILMGGVNATRLCPDYVWTPLPACFTTSQVDLKHSTGVKHALDLALLIKVEVGSADSEPGIGYF